MNAGVILGRLSPYRAQESKITEDQSTGDIIDAIVKSHKIYAPEYKKICHAFRGSTPRETGKKLFDFLKKNVKYRIEPGNRQTVKSPAAIIAEGHGDCKHYSAFIAGCLDAMGGIPWSYRFASYKMFDPQPGHVFVVINPGTDREIWVDPVLTSFDYKKPYINATDRKMAIYSISGIGATKAVKKAAKAEKKAARKAAGKTLGQKIKKGTKAVLKVAASPARNAFLLLVKINFANLAVKLKKAWEKEPSKVQIFWEQIGGRIQALKTQWEKGATKKRIFGAEVGAVPAAAAVTAAAPIIAKVASVLKDIGIDPDELVQIGKDAINEKAQQLAKKVLMPKAAKEAAQIDVAEQVEADGVTATAAPEFKAKTSTMLPLLIGGAAVLYFATRKK